MKYCLTILYKDNAVCIVQLKKCYIKWDTIKHISQKYTQGLEEW